MLHSDPRHPTGHASPAPPLRGAWYLLLVPMAALYTVGAGKLAGPGYTTAPEQGAMVLFFLAVLAWPMLALFPLEAIRRLAGIRGPWGVVWGAVSWAASAAVPFLIGMA